MALRLLVSKAGATELVYDTSPTQMISPTCGCAREDSAAWRGITFLAERFQIDAPRAANSRAAAYTVFAPNPGPFTYLPLQFRLNVTEYDVSLPAGVPLRVQVRRDGPPIVSGGRAAVLQTGTPHLYTFVSDGPLTLETTGDLPIGAWIPLRNSRVRLSATTSARDLDLTRYSITERYLADPQLVRAAEARSNNLDTGYPAVDFIGPVVWGWARQQPENGQQHYAVVRIEAPYAIRIVIEPVTGQGRYEVLGPRPVGGEAGLSFVKTSSDIRRYHRLRDRIASNPVDLATLQNRADTDGRGTRTKTSSFMVMVAPPAPVGDGFNVYGSIGALRMENASGTLMIGANSWEMRNAQLSLSNLRGFVRNGIGSSLPIQMAGDSVTVDAEFSAVGGAVLNGERVTTAMRNWDYFFQGMNVAALFAGVLTALISLLAWAGERFRHSRASARP